MMFYPSYLLTPGVGHLCTLLRRDWLTHRLLIYGAVHGVCHVGAGGVLIVEITNRVILTHHLGHSHWYLGKGGVLHGYGAQGDEQAHLFLHRVALLPCYISTVIFISCPDLNTSSGDGKCW